MGVLHELLKSAVVQRAGWTILHSLWEGAAVAVVLLVLRALLRSYKPQVRYLVSCGGMLALLVMPLVTFVLLPDATIAPPAAKTRINAAAPGQLGPAVPVRAIDLVANAPRGATQANRVARPAPRVINEPAPYLGSVWAWWLHETVEICTPLVPWLVLTWATGVLVLSLWHLGGFLTVHQLKRASVQSAGAAAERLAARLVERMGLHQTVRVLGSALAQTPLVIGAFKPVILVPLSVLCELPASELESILAHELAHVRRHDYVVNLAQSAIATLLFYHPAAWWVCGRISIEREHCCDDLVLQFTRDRATYARALAAVASVRIPALAPAASGGKLLPRLRRIVGAPDAHGDRLSAWIAGAIVIVCCAVGALAVRTKSAPNPGRELQANSSKSAESTGNIIHVRGVVLLPDGKPAWRAQVEIAPNFRQDDPDVPAGAISRTTSGPDGRFQITLDKSKLSPFILQDGSSGRDLWKKAAVMARADGFGLAWSAWDKTDPNGDVILRLVPDLSIEGRIVDLEGRAVPNVKVMATGLINHAMVEFSDYNKPPAGLSDLNLPENSVTSGRDGRFRITGLGAERTAMLQFSSPAASVPRIRVVTRRMKPTSSRIGRRDTFVVYGADFEITAGPARSVRGIVRDAKTRRPLAGVPVRTWSNFSMQTITDEQGRFEFDGLPKKDGISVETLPYDRAPYFTAEAEVPNQPGAKPVEVDIDLQSGVWVTGKVTDKETSKPVPAIVEYVPFLSNRNASRVFPSNIGYSQSPGHSFTKSDGTYRVAALPGSGMIGVICNDPRYRKGVGEDRITERNPQGRIKAYSPANMTGFFNAVKEVSIAPGAAGGAADVQLDPGGSIQLSFTDLRGKPIGNVDVVAKPGHNDYSTHSDRPGLLVTGLAPAEKRIVIVMDHDRKLGKVLAIGLKDAPARKLNVQLEPVAVVTGRLLNQDGNPLHSSQLRVSTRFVELRGDNRELMRGLRTGPDGRFTLELPSGCHYVLGASYDVFGGRVAWFNEDLPVRPGETKDLGDIRLPAMVSP